MKKYVKKVILSLLVVMLVFTQTEVQAVEEELVSVIILENDDEIILADVPANMEQDFIQEISDPERLQFYINESKQNIYSRTPGNCRVRYHNSTEFLKVMSELDKSFNYLAYLTNPFAPIVVKRAVTFLKARTGAQLAGLGFFGILSGIVGWAASSLQARQANWWKDTYILFLEGEISGVKMELCENVSGSSYPAAYRYITRY